MERIQAISFLVLGQLAVGGTLLLSLPSLTSVGISFYRTNGIVLGVALLIGLSIGGPPVSMLFQTIPSLFYVGFAVLLFIYNLRLWFRRPYHSRILLWSAALLGNISLLFSFISYLPQEASPLRILILSLDAVVSNLLLGCGVLAMLLGHRYLTHPTLSLVPLRRLSQIFMGLVFIEGVLAVINLMVSLSSERMFNAIALNTFEGVYLWIRFAIGIIGPMILAFLILKTVSVRATMSATGLLYIAMLMVIIGALFSHFFLLVNQTLI